MNRAHRNAIESIRLEKATEQQFCCALCGVDLKTVKMCLDHDHKTGQIRDVLCLNCNGIEGKIFNLCRRAKRDSTEFGFLEKILSYWARHSGLYRLLGDSITVHPLHKTQDEKRLAKNKKARLRRKKNNK